MEHNNSGTVLSMCHISGIMLSVVCIGSTLKTTTRRPGRGEWTWPTLPNCQTPEPMSSLQEPSHYISTAILQNNYYCLHFGDEKTEPQFPKSQTKDKSPHYLHCITVSSLIQHVSENNGKTVSFFEHSKKGFICIPFLNPHSNIKKKQGSGRTPKSQFNREGNLRLRLTCPRLYKWRARARLCSQIIYFQTQSF